MIIRHAEHEDALAVAQVHVRSWQVAYRALLPAEYLSNLRPEERAAKYDLANRAPTKPQTIVATEGGSVLGFATVSPSGDEDLADSTELAALYVDPESWGRGIGVALIMAARKLMVEMKFRNSLLWLLSGNARAARFYELDGWTMEGTRRTIAVWGIEVEEVRYVRQLPGRN